MITKIQPSHVTLTVICVTILATEAAVGGLWLHSHGYPGGAGLTLIILNTAISGLIGFLGGRGSAQTMLPEVPKLP